MVHTRKNSLLVCIVLVSMLATMVIKGSAQPAEKLKGKLVFWGGAYNMRQTKWVLSEKLLKRNPELKIEAVGYPYTDYPTKDRIALAAGLPEPDIVELHAHWVRPFFEGGLLLDLTDYVKKIQGDFQADLWPQITDSKGHIYGFPFQSTLTTFYYRKDIYEKYGLTIPDTVDQLIDTGGKLRAQGKYVIDLDARAGDIDMFNLWLTALGGNYFDKNGKLILDTPEGHGIEAATVGKRLVDSGVVFVAPNLSPETWTAIDQGTLASKWHFSWFSHWISDQIKPGSESFGKLSVARAPAIVPGGYRNGMSRWKYISINKNSKRKDLAWKVVKYLKASVESEATFSNYYGNVSAYLPAVEALAKGVVPLKRWPLFGDQYLAQVQAKRAPLDRPRPLCNVGPLSEAMDLIAAELSRMYVGEISPEEAIKLAARKIRRIVE